MDFVGLSSPPQPNSMANTITIRREPKSDQFEIVFRLRVPELQLSREFHLNRQVTETVEVLLARLKTNMEKAFGKKLKKVKGKLNIEKGSVEEKKFLQITADVWKHHRTVPRQMTCEQLLFNPAIDPSDLIFVLCGVSFWVSINAPYVRSLTLPDVAMLDLPLFPLKFSLKFAEPELSSFEWYSSVDGSTWTPVGRGFLYRPTSEDLGKTLKLECQPRSAKQSGVKATAVCEKPVSQLPAERPYVKRHKFTELRAASPSFRIVSYNVLSDKYAETEAANAELYPYCPDFARRWQYRRSLLVDEILGYRGDILCLQEVDTKAFESDLTNVLKREFVGIYNKKSTVEEGVAIFFNRNRFKLLSHHSCHFGLEIDVNPLFSDIWDKIKDNEALSSRIKGLGTVAQVVVLSDNDSDRTIVVGNTHLYFHPDADHIRLLQGGLFAKFIVDVITTTRLKRSNVALVVGGDFNSVPSCGIFSLLTTGYAPPDLPDWRSKEGEHVVDLELRQPLVISSAYGTPKYTNFTKEFADCLDYIFYQSDKLKLLSTVPLYSDDELRAHVALPSIVCPSDHVALVADLSWIRIESTNKSQKKSDKPL